MDIYLAPAVIALVAAALTGWFHKKERTSVTFAVIAFLAITIAIDPYRIKAMESSITCIQDSGCTNDGLMVWIVPFGVGLAVCIIVGLLFAGLAKLIIRQTIPAIDAFEFDPIIWPQRPGEMSRKRHWWEDKTQPRRR